MTPIVHDVSSTTLFRAPLQALEKVEQTLREEKRANPQTIPYRLSPMKKHADYFLLSYLPKQRLVKEHVRVTPVGFSYRRHTFGSVEQLLRWFKLHFKEPPSSQHLDPAATAATFGGLALAAL